MINPITKWRDREKDCQYLNKIGRIISFTKVNNPPVGFGQLPYYVAIVKFSNSKKRVGQLVLNGQEPKVKDKVRGVLRRVGLPSTDGIINYGIKFQII